MGKRAVVRKSKSADAGDAASVGGGNQLRRLRFGQRQRLFSTGQCRDSIRQRTGVSAEDSAFLARPVRLVEPCVCGFHIGSGEPVGRVEKAADAGCGPNAQSLVDWSAGG